MFGDYSYYFTHSLEITKDCSLPPDVKNRIMTANFSSAEIGHASLFLAFQFFLLFQQIIKSVRADSLCLKNCSLSFFQFLEGYVKTTKFFSFLEYFSDPGTSINHTFLLFSSHISQIHFDSCSRRSLFVLHYMLLSCFAILLSF